MSIDIEHLEDLPDFLHSCTNLHPITIHKHSNFSPIFSFILWESETYNNLLIAKCYFLFDCVLGDLYLINNQWCWVSCHMLISIIKYLEKDSIPFLIFNLILLIVVELWLSHSEKRNIIECKVSV